MKIEFLSGGGIRISGARHSGFGDIMLGKQDAHELLRRLKNALTPEDDLTELKQRIERLEKHLEPQLFCPTCGALREGEYDKHDL